MIGAMADIAPRLGFRVLGPLRVTGVPPDVDLRAPMQRRLLLLFLIHRNEVLSKDRIQDALWPADEGDKTSALRFHLSKLRDAIDPDRTGVIATEGAGYAMAVSDDQLDASAFTHLLADAGDHLGVDPARALETLEEALALWRGPAFADAEFDDFARPEIARLEELRVRAVEDRMEAMLVLGRHDAAIAELEALVHRHPLRERLRGQLMLALYRGGRQAEALRAYTDAKDTLGEELGIEPSDELKDLEEKILFQEAELLQAPAPTAATIVVPEPASALIGRTAELEAIAALARRSRLVTLTGIGGVGKTRLAQAYASGPDRGFEAVWWVNLAPVTRDESVAGAVAAAVGAEDRPDTDATSGVIEHLRPWRALIVLDNCEQIVEAAGALVSSVLAACPGVSVLATSRRPLHVRGEAIREVPRLATPAEDADEAALLASEAVAFFAEIAERRGRLFPPKEVDAVAAIVRRLDGIPLAIELAVARLGALTPTLLAERLAEDLGALGSGSVDEPEHRRTMHATIDWSVRLLSSEGSALFERFGVFSEGAPLDAVESVCADGLLADRDVLPALEEVVEASLIERRETPPGLRFVMLQPVAAVAAERLGRSAVADSVSEVHARHFAAFSAAGYDGLIGSDQAAVLARFDAEESNLREALAWSTEVHPDLAIEVAYGLGRYWSRRGLHSEARRVLGTLVADPGLTPSAALADVLGTLSYLDLLTGKTERSLELATRQAAVAEASGAFTSQVRARFTIASVHWAQGQTAAAAEQLAEAVDELGSQVDPLEVYMLRGLGRMLIRLGHRDEIRRLITQLSWWADQGHPVGSAAGDELEATLAYYRGDLERATRHIDRAVSATRLLGTRHDLADVLNVAAIIALARGDWDGSTTLAIEAGELAEETLARGVEALSLALLGNALLRSGREATARRNLERAVELAFAAPAMFELVWALSFQAAYSSIVHEDERAVVLHAAAMRLQADLELAAPETLRAYRETDLAQLEDRLGSERFAELWTDGSTRSANAELVAFATS